MIVERKEHKSTSYQLIENFFLNDEIKNGLFLLDTPTGFGKTHTMLEIMYEMSKKDLDPHHKVIYLASMKNNLPIRNFEQMFKNDNRLNDYNNSCLFLDSYTENIKNFFDEVGKDIPPDIKKTNEYNEVNQQINSIKSLENIAGSALSLSTLNSTLMKTIEPNFRRLLHNRINEQFDTLEKRIEAVTTGNWQWLGKLYPSVYTNSRKFIFMSVDKFFTSTDPIIDKMVLFYSPEVLKKSQIVIDEFDGTKETLMNRIIEEGINDKIDFVDMFTEIYMVLNSKEFPAEMTRVIMNKNNINLNDIVQSLKDSSRSIYSDYHLESEIKIDDSSKSKDNYFLFYDFSFHTLIEGDKNLPIITYNEEKRINEIHIISSDNYNNSDNLYRMLNRIRGFIRSFEKKISLISQYYMQNCNAERKPGEGEYTLQDAVSSVLNLFSLNSNYQKYLEKNITMIADQVFNRKGEDSEFNLGFYENGFRYFMFEDKYEHNMQTKIMLVDYENTPEKLMLNICRLTKVVGLSATGTLKTVLKNYDLDYLRYELGDAFYTPLKSDVEKLKAEFRNEYSGYDNVKIHVTLFDYDNESNAETLERIFSDCNLTEDKIKHIHDEILEKNNNSYIKKRYLKIFEFIKEYLIHEEINSGICLLNILPKDDNDDLDYHALKEVFNCLKAGLMINDESDLNVVKALNYRQKISMITSNLEKGKKELLISSYKTIGTGQNLQYHIPKGMNGLVKINTYENSECKDYDAMFVDTPTNIMASLKDRSEKNIAKRIFQEKNLEESFEQSRSVTLANIKTALNVLVGTKRMRTIKNPENCQSFKNAVTGVTMQGIGRMCRTNMKNKDINIYADKDLRNYIEPSIQDRLLNYEFRELINAFKIEDGKAEDLTDNMATIINQRDYQYFKRVLSNNWNEEKINNWQELREYALKHPTITEDDYKTNEIARNFYVKVKNKANALYYTQKNDYSDIKVFETKNNSALSEVSELDARLNVLMNNSFLKKSFEDNEYATSFIENDYIMSPIFYNNIYKGALGEASGKFLLEKTLGLKLVNLPKEIYELFDYKIENTNIFIDFKHWKDSDEFNNQQMLNKIADKASKAGADVVIIVNILAQRCFETLDTYMVDSSIHLIVIPSLISLNEDEKTYQLNDESFAKIRKCVNDYDKNQ